VAGDTIYGRSHASIPLQRHFLHAQRLTIRLPNEKTVHTFLAALPTELALVLEKLRK